MSPEPPSDIPRDFDTDAAWLRRLSADAAGELHALALRLREAMPDLVTVEETRPLFGRARTTGITVALGDRSYRLFLHGNRLQGSIALSSRGITLNTRPIDPADWFAQLRAETAAAGDRARALARSLAGFMAG